MQRSVGHPILSRENLPLGLEGIFGGSASFIPFQSELEDDGRVELAIMLLPRLPTSVADCCSVNSLLVINASQGRDPCWYDAGGSTTCSPALPDSSAHLLQGLSQSLSGETDGVVVICRPFWPSWAGRRLCSLPAPVPTGAAGAGHQQRSEAGGRGEGRGRAGRCVHGHRRGEEQQGRHEGAAWC